MKQGTVECRILDDTMPVGPVQRTITYLAPFDRCCGSSSLSTQIMEVGILIVGSEWRGGY